MPPGIISMTPGGINDHDVICGRMNSVLYNYGFLWDRASGQYTTISLPPGANRIRMESINNDNQVAVTLFYDSAPFGRSAVWSDGSFYPVAEELNPFTSLAYAINEIGDVAGYYMTQAPEYDQRGYATDAGEAAQLPHPADLETSEVWCMSNNGCFGGQGLTRPIDDPTYARHGIVWSASGPEVILPPSTNRWSVIYDINDAGRAVGHFDQPTYGLPSYSFVWQNGSYTGLRDLTPGIPGLGRARGINNVGQIIAGGTSRSFVLTPVWLPGDLTGDCHVSFDDLVLVLSNFGLPRGTFPRGDVDGDGEVDLSDLAILLAHWGE